MQTPSSHAYFSQRLRLHYIDWGNDDAPPLLLIHGGRDHCRNWDWVAQAFRDKYHVIAPDLRGHGDSQWMIGGNYGMPDYVYDIAQLIHQIKLHPLRIIGHSLGGAVTLMYSGIYPQNVIKVVAIEGLGPSPEMLAKRADKSTRERACEWIAAIRAMSARVPRRYPTREEAFKRMQEANPYLTPEQACHLTVHGTNQNEDGTFSWKFDNYVRAFSAFAFNVNDQVELWREITCPLLLVRGTESWGSDPSQDGRASYFRDATVVNIEKAGHWVHHDQLDRFVAVTREFLRD
jgi:pimeloyl-ACP methyl ester carboxylesterase